jgi:hypothetical protein
MFDELKIVQIICKVKKTHRVSFVFPIPKTIKFNSAMQIKSLNFTKLPTSTPKNLRYQGGVCKGGSQKAPRVKSDHVWRALAHHLNIKELRGKSQVGGKRLPKLGASE